MLAIAMEQTRYRSSNFRGQLASSTLCEGPCFPVRRIRRRIINLLLATEILNRRTACFVRGIQIRPVSEAFSESKRQALYQREKQHALRLRASADPNIRYANRKIGLDSVRTGSEKLPSRRCCLFQQPLSVS